MVTIPVDISKISKDGILPETIPIKLKDIEEASKDISQSNMKVEKSQNKSSLDNSLNK